MSYFEDTLAKYCFTSTAQCSIQVRDAIQDEFDDVSNRKRQRVINFLSTENDILLKNIIQLQQRIEKQEDVDGIVKDINIMEKEIAQSKFMNEDEKAMGRVIISLAFESASFWNTVEIDKRHPIYFSGSNARVAYKQKKKSKGISIRTKNAVLAVLDAAFKSVRNKKSRKLQSSDIQNLFFRSVPASFHAFRILQETSTLENDVNGVKTYTADCSDDKPFPSWLCSIFDFIKETVEFFLSLFGLINDTNTSETIKCIEKLSIGNHIVVNGKLELSNLELSLSLGNGSIEIAENGYLSVTNCFITDSSYCPAEFAEIDDKCYHVTAETVQSSESSNKCQTIDSRSYSPTYSDLPMFGLQNLLHIFPEASNSTSVEDDTDFSVWISSESDISSCASIDGDIALTDNASNCARIHERRVLCVAPIKNPITNNGIYFSESSRHYFNTHQDLARHMVDPRSVPSESINSSIALWKMDSPPPSMHRLYSINRRQLKYRGDYYT